MTPWLDDGDVRVHVGDVRAVLAAMPDESVDCVITSPPYWGLRDYGTGSWDGGNDPACDHLGQPFRTKSKLNENWGADVADVKNAEGREPMGQTCSKCGARRFDQQLGLEETPALYVENMVAVFREIRRVLSPWGTVFLNLGDSYAGSWGAQSRGNTTGEDKTTLGDGIKPKDLVGIPWRVAFALQADGWWLRSEIIWAKPNPMPESVTDRPTKSHEQVFLLAKRPVYWFDQEAVREPHRTADDARNRDDYEPERGTFVGGGVNDGRTRTTGASTWPNGGRNVRSVWEIATQPFPDAHFATFPEELVRRCLLAGCPAEVCSVCSKPRERLLEKRATGKVRQRATGGLGTEVRRETHGLAPVDGTFQEGVSYETVGWSDCGHNAYRPGRVLDPFLGSGTTALVARNHGRHAVGIELNEEYARIAARRLQQLSLLA